MSALPLIWPSERLPVGGREMTTSNECYLIKGYVLIWVKAINPEVGTDGTVSEWYWTTTFCAPCIHHEPWQCLHLSPRRLTGSHRQLSSSSVLCRMHDSRQWSMFCISSVWSAPSYKHECWSPSCVFFYGQRIMRTFEGVRSKLRHMVASSRSASFWQIRMLFFGDPEVCFVQHFWVYT
jgi:hypothetical protein